MATKKKAAPKRKPVRVVTAPRDVLLRSALSKAEAERDQLRTILRSEEQKSRYRSAYIEILNAAIVEVGFELDHDGEHICEIAARLLREQLDKIKALEADLSFERHKVMHDSEAEKKAREAERGSRSWPEPTDVAHAQRFTREVGR